MKKTMVKSEMCVASYASNLRDTLSNTTEYITLQLEPFTDKWFAVEYISKEDYEEELLKNSKGVVNNE